MSAIFGETLVFKQGNGSTIELVVYGDEFYARYETKDGYTVVYDTDLDAYCYAILLDGRFASSGVPIFKPVPPGVRTHLKESAAVRNQKFAARYAKMRPLPSADASHFMRTYGANEGLLPGRRVSEGQVRGLTLLVEFSDVPTTVTAEDVDAMLNAEGYEANGNYCSVREYFMRMSSGKLDYTNHVVGPVRLSQDQDYYKTHLLVQEALELAVGEYGLDLAGFASRGDGIVDALNVMYAGRTVYEGDLWPHNWSIDLSYGGVQTHFYMLTSLGRHRVDLSIGTFCHENGHQLCRFPDLYDYGTWDGDFEASRGLGVYCLMGAGNHLGLGRTPSPVCAYLRYLVGWYDREILLDGVGVYEARHGDYGTILKYETEKLNEYFLIENRSRLGFDVNLPSSGLAIYHCDTLGSNEWQGGTRERHYQCGLLQADGHLDLENNRNPGDESDLFAEIGGVALSHETIPSSRAWDGSGSGLVVSDISAPGEVMWFRVGEEAKPLVVTADVTADLLIPDYDPQGVYSEIPISRTGQIRGIKVSVDIIHTYVGDLQVEIEAPFGKTALLHDRTGGTRDDIRDTYDSDSNLALQGFVGESLRGIWRLYVRDLLRRDTGRLNRWQLEIEYASVDRVVEVEATPNATIPDADPSGIASAIDIDDMGTVKDVRVSVEIAHTFIGDLRVELIAPSGQRALLHNRAGGGKDDLRITYDIASAPALEGLIGGQIKGVWVLQVQDLQLRDVGTLEKWSLALTY